MPAEPALKTALTRMVHHVRAVSLGHATSFEDGHLTVAPDDVAACFTSPALASVEVSWVSPGDSARIVKVLDAVEPRTKAAGGGGVFPGFVGPARAAGGGVTHVLRGAAVVAAGYLPRAQEALVDLSGPGAALSPLGSTHNLVVEFVPAPEADWAEVDRALRLGLLKAAVRLADAALDAEPDEVEELPAVAPGARAGQGALPRVGAITNLQTQGSFKDVYVYGRSFGTSLPTLLDATEVEDGAVVSGQFGHPALKNPTFVHQNHPVLAELRRRDGQDLTFAGLVISPEPVEATQKELTSAHAGTLGAALGWDAAVVTKEGGGNADGDMALKMDALEERGVTAVGIFAEMAGPDGTGPPIVVPPNRATAMVSSGNYDERITLPAVDRALGGERLALLDVPATAEMILPVAVIYGSDSPVGWGRLTCREQDPTEGAPLEERAPHDGPIRVVHYVNQFFAGLGGEDAANTGADSRPGPVGPGRKLADLLGPGFEVVATVFCGDDYAVSGPAVTEEVLALVQAAEPDLLVAGPAFTSGRYGLACARLVAAAQATGLAAVAALHGDNPGVDEAGAAPVVAAGEAARTMGPSLERLAAAAAKLAAGETLTADDGRVGKVPRRN
ncbi:MAG: glycine/betaine/sarcosine/D-proline family reductase selenoprotein B, partial [Acidimicrobiales bacterium]